MDSDWLARGQPALFVGADCSDAASKVGPGTSGGVEVLGLAVAARVTLLPPVEVHRC